jgi:hypothetical protein
MAIPADSRRKAVNLAEEKWRLDPTNAIPGERWTLAARF